MATIKLSFKPPAIALPRFSPIAMVVLFAVLIGAALRLNGLRWDQNAHYHPDERFISSVTAEMKWPTSFSQWLNTRQSPMNPYWNLTDRREQAFAYGTLPVYLTKAVGTVLGAVTGAKWDGYDESALVGRALSGLADSAAIFLVFLLGARVFDRKVGAIASVLYAFTVLSIQHSHFYTTDITLNFFVLLTIYCAVRLSESGSPRAALATGAALGMALASKTSGAPLAAVIPVALVLFVVRRHKVGAAWSLADFSPVIPTLVLATLSTLALFFVWAPYAILDSAAFIRNFKEQNDILISGDADRPFTRQYFGTAPYLYPLEQMARWSLGLPLGVIAYAGFVVMVIIALRKRALAPGSVLILAWMIPYFLITGRAYAKFLRYMLPLLPLLAICAALALRELGRALARVPHVPLVRWVSPVLTALLLVSTAWWAFAFSRIYSEPHTANKAAAWINENIPKSAAIGMEHWEEGIAGLVGFQKPPGSIQLLSYDDDSPAKINMYATALQQNDYIAMYSNRLYGTVPHIPARYPMARAFYEKFFNGELGYELAYFSESYPQFLGLAIFEDTFSRPDLPRPEPIRDYHPAPLTINGGFADESFSAYDHPLVMVFKRTRQLNPGELNTLLKPYLPAQPWNPALSANQREPLLTAQQRTADMAGGTFSALFDPGDLVNQVPVLAWWLVIQLLSFMAFPLVAIACKLIPDRGYILARGVGWLVLAWLVWFPVSLGLIPYTRSTIVAAIVVMTVAAAAVFWLNRNDLIRWMASHWKLIALEEALFTLAFVAFILIRMGNPDLWHPARGGEKPMDFAYLMATIKSTTMPPFDPWFAGGFINYYYYGQFLVSVIVKLTGVLPEVAYNLAIPTLFALTFTFVFSVASNLASLNGRKQATDPEKTTWSFMTNRLAILAGILSALFVTVFGNVDGGLRIFKRLVSIGGATPVPEANIGAMPLVTMLPRFLSGLVKAVAQGQTALQIPPDWYWASTRLYPGSGSIQEFPFFTFLYADLHAHMIALPFTILVLSLALAMALTVRANESVRDWFRLPTLSVAAITAIALGSLYPINSWDYPTYALAIGGAMLLGWWHADRTTRSLGLTLASGFAIAAASFALYGPFHATFVQGYTGFISHDERSPLTGYLTMFGLALFGLLPWVVLILRNWLAGARAQDIRSTSTTFASATNLRTRLTPVREGTVDKSKSVFRGLRLLLDHPQEANHIVALMFALQQTLLRSPSSTLASLESVDPMAIGVTGLSDQETNAMQPSRSVARPNLATRMTSVVGLLLIALVVVKLLFDAFGVVVLLGALGALLMTAISITRKSLAESFLFAAAALAFIVTAGVDIWSLKGDLGRMNTVFKFYLQAWTLFGIAAGVGVVKVLAALRPKVAQSDQGSSRMRRTALSTAWCFGLALVVLCGLAYPMASVYAKINDRFDGTHVPPTLDGMRYLTEATYVDEAEVAGQRKQAALKLSDDLAAIQWIRANLPGSPLVLEAPSGPPPHPGLYRWGNRVAIYTGNPTLIGWDWHERQQRLGTPQIETRVNDVLQIYTGPDLGRTRMLLSDYGVNYIYLGAEERLHYPSAEAKLIDMGQRGLLTKIYDASNVTIWQVL